jgi:hypothetical protein
VRLLGPLISWQALHLDEDVILLDLAAAVTTCCKGKRCVCTLCVIVVSSNEHQHISKYQCYTTRKQNKRPKRRQCIRSRTYRSSIRASGLALALGTVKLPRSRNDRSPWPRTHQGQGTETTVKGSACPAFYF